MRAISVIKSVILAALGSLAVVGLSNAQQEYGQTDFEASGSRAAHAEFTRGLLQLHNFEYEDARASFQSALEKSVLSELSLPPRAESRNAIIFFLDIAQFTGRCERYTPKEIVSQINNLFERITEIIIKNDGDIDKFMG